jgi:hypothetical protein
MALRPAAQRGLAFNRHGDRVAFFDLDESRDSLQIAASGSFMKPSLHRDPTHESLAPLERFVESTLRASLDANMRRSPIICAIRCERVAATNLSEAARAVLADAWHSIAPANAKTQEESFRHGPRPRCGVYNDRGGGKVCWANSLAHSAAGPTVVAAVLEGPIDASGQDHGWTIGVDVEPTLRFVHGGVRGMVSSTSDTEACAVVNGYVPLLATICVKEAVFKSDVSQDGRVLADYAWIEARPFGSYAWHGTVKAAGESTARFVVAVAEYEGMWVAAAVSTSIPS